MGAGNREAKKSRGILRQNVADVDRIALPSIEDQRIFLDQLSSAGDLTPEMIQALNLEASAMEGVSTDPRLKSQQMNALAQLSGISETGMSAADAAGFELARRNAAQENQAMQGQILQNMQARGQGGSGAELIARLNTSQKSADSLQAAQLEQAKAQQAARMQALSQVGDLSSGIRNQDFSEASQVAQAKDLINKFNVSNKQAVANQNAQARNLAQQQNLQNQQNIMNQNVGTRNQQQQYNKELAQRQFNNEVQKQGLKSGANLQLAGNYQNDAAGARAMEGQLIGAAIGAGATAYTKKPPSAGT